MGLISHGREWLGVWTLVRSNPFSSGNLHEMLFPVGTWRPFLAEMGVQNPGPRAAPAGRASLLGPHFSPEPFCTRMGGHLCMCELTQWTQRGLISKHQFFKLHLKKLKNLRKWAVLQSTKHTYLGVIHCTQSCVSLRPTGLCALAHLIFPKACKDFPLLPVRKPRCKKEKGGGCCLES